MQVFTKPFAKVSFLSTFAKDLAKNAAFAGASGVRRPAPKAVSRFMGLTFKCAVLDV